MSSAKIKRYPTDFKQLWESGIHRSFCYGFPILYKMVISPIAVEEKNVIIVEVGILSFNHDPIQTVVVWGNLTYSKLDILS